MNCLVMGVLNVTPDSFSDGGRYLSPEAALAHARELVAQGAHIVDVGGESTRPGADRITADEEQDRILPIIRALADDGITVSVDTVNAATARAAVEAGASIINDVSGGTADPQMRAVAAETGATFVIMHWRGVPDLGHSKSTYDDVVEDVRAQLAQLADAALAAGVSVDKIVLDPGLGFDKTAAQGWQLLAGFDRLASLGFPVLVGVSRKRMLGETLDEFTGRASTMSERDAATAAVSAYSSGVGAWGVRVHDVRSTVSALAVAQALQGAGHAASAASSVPAASSASSSSASSFCVSSPVTQLVSGGRSPASNPTPTHQLGQFGRDSQPADCAPVDGVPADRKPADRITLTGLEVFANHGVFDFEREQGQRFVIDAEVVLDLAPAAAGDELARTVNYAQLSAELAQAAIQDPVDLIETLAERLASVALGFAGVTETTITVHKPDAPIDAKFDDVAVTITRWRSRAPQSAKQVPQS